MLIHGYYDPLEYRDTINLASLRDAMYLPDGGPTYEPEPDTLTRVLNWITQPSLDIDTPGYPTDKSINRESYIVRTPDYNETSKVPVSDFSKAEQQRIAEYIDYIQASDNARKRGIPANTYVEPNVVDNLSIPYNLGYGTQTAVMYPSGDIRYDNGVIESPKGMFNYDPNQTNFNFEDWVRNDTKLRLDAAKAEFDAAPYKNMNVYDTYDRKVKAANDRLSNALSQVRSYRQRANSIGAQK